MGGCRVKHKDRLAFVTRGLTKSYGEGRSTVHALRGVDLDIPEGEIVVMLGASGSGKSTLLNILGGLDRPTSGTARFRDIDMGSLSDEGLTKFRRMHVGFVFQFYNLMPSLTALENVELVTEIAENPMPAQRALELVGLTHRLDHFPSQLSGGEQQRVAIARAIAKQPDVLFCDEPTGALDSATGRAVLEVLNQVNAELNATVLMVTHAANIAGMAHRVIRLVDGQIGRVEVNETRLPPAEIEW